MSNRKKITLSLTALAVLITVVFLSLFFTIWKELFVPDLDFDAYVPDKVLSQKQSQKDKKQMIKKIEKTHYYFLENKDRSAYEENKNFFLDAKVETALDLFMEASRYLAFFEDMHTETIFVDAVVIPNPDDVEKIFYDTYADKMVIVEEDTTYDLIAVNGVMWKDILQKSISYFPLENRHSLAIKSFYPLTTAYLSWLGFPLFDGYAEFTLQDSEGNIVTSVYPKQSPQKEWSSPPNFFAEVKDDNVLYIKSLACYDDGSFNDTLNTVKQAVANGIQNVIFDVRLNSGGSDSYMLSIIEALGLDYTQKATRYISTRLRAGLDPAILNDLLSNPNQIDFKVICDEWTFSAGTLPVFSMKYSKLGEIIGRAPGQKPNFYGSAVFYQSKYSKVPYRMSTNMNTWETGGEPVGDVCDVDIFVPYGQDPMDYIVFK